MSLLNSKKVRKNREEKISILLQELENIFTEIDNIETEEIYKYEDRLQDKYINFAKELISIKKQSIKTLHTLKNQDSEIE
jgi:hypothetical protein